MSEQPPSPQAFRTADLARRQRHTFDIRPDPAALAALCDDLRLLGLRKLSFAGTLDASGKADWQLTARLGATVIQPCAVTLAPVTTRIDTEVTRLFQASVEEIDATEIEMPEDDSTEPLTRWIDPVAVMEEALVLALPLYPRAEGAELGESVFAEPGVVPLRDEDTRPFAGLAGLRDQLGKPDGSGGDET